MCGCVGEWVGGCVGVWVWVDVGVGVCVSVCLFTDLCQPHSLKGCHIFVINLSKTCHPQFLFFAIGGIRVPI